MVGGFVVTDRMLEMFKAKPRASHASAAGGQAEDAGPVSPGAPPDAGRRFTWPPPDLVYLIAIVGFILALKGLSSPTHARRGNLVGAAAADRSPSA